MNNITQAFKSTGREQLTRAELIAAGARPTGIDRAVRSGALRAGVCGYWLPRAADPGALAVLRGALRARPDAEEIDA